MLDHAFCPRHRCAYNALMDPTCPQCTLAGVVPPDQLEYDAQLQRPLNAAGRPVHPRTLQEEK